MSYCYSDWRHEVFKEENQELFLGIRDKADEICALAGCVESGKLMNEFTGSSWLMLACMDRLVELGYLKEITNPGKVWDQHRIFARVRKEA